LSGQTRQIPLTISVPEAGRACSLGRARSYASALAGELPVISFGRAKRVPVARLAEMLGVTTEELLARLEEDE